MTLRELCRWGAAVQETCAEDLEVYITLGEHTEPMLPVGEARLYIGREGEFFVVVLAQVHQRFC